MGLQKNVKRRQINEETGTASFGSKTLMEDRPAMVEALEKLDEQTKLFLGEVTVSKSGGPGVQMVATLV